MLLQTAGQLALKLGFSVRRNMPAAKMRALFDYLKPYDTDKPLVRIGGDHDGGYLVPDDLDGIGACFSPGVDFTATFEKALVDRGIPCFLADASVDAAPVADPLIQFSKKFIDVVNDDMNMRMDSWIEASAAGDQDYILQMDIEGAEWRVLLDMSPACLAKFRIIILELHGIHHAFDHAMHDIVLACLKKIGDQFVVVHNHPNNSGGHVEVDGMTVPKLLEVTFLRKDRANALRPATIFPHPLDEPCVATLPEMVLPPSLRH